MKNTERKLERLMELTGAAEDQAETALFDAEGDLLGALIELEESGAVEFSGVGFYSTAGTFTSSDYRIVPDPVTPAAEPIPGGLPGKLRWLWHFLVNNRLEAYRKYDPTRQIQCPLGALIALFFIAWYVVLFILAIGVCMGWHYRFGGPQLGQRKINQIMVRIDDWAENLRDNLSDAIFKKK